MNKILYLKNYLIPYLILIIVVIISFFPFFWMISTSLMTIGETINRSLIPESPQWINYSTTWYEGKFSKYLINSFIITFVSVFGLLITSIFAAYAFAKINFPGRNFYFFVILSTMMIPEVVTIMPHVLIIRGDVIPLPFGPSWMNSLQGITVPLMANAFSIFLLRSENNNTPSAPPLQNIRPLVNFITSGPVVVQILEGKNAISNYRDIMGETNPKEAKPGTIRAQFAESIEAN